MEYLKDTLLGSSINFLAKKSPKILVKGQTLQLNSLRHIKSFLFHHYQVSNLFACSKCFVFKAEKAFQLAQHFKSCSGLSQGGAEQGNRQKKTKIDDKNISSVTKRSSMFMASSSNRKRLGLRQEKSRAASANLPESKKLASKNCLKETESKISFTQEGIDDIQVPPLETFFFVADVLWPML